MPVWIFYWSLSLCIAAQQVNEEASEKVLEVEQKYNEIRRPVYDKRNEVIKSIPDFWLTAVRNLATLFSCSLRTQKFYFFSF